MDPKFCIINKQLERNMPITSTMTTRRLVPLVAFDSVFGPIRGKKVVYQEVLGNVGDMLIYAATRQLFRHFDVTAISLNDPDAESGECVVCCGGGNMGGEYLDCLELRKKAYQLAQARGLEVLILPQSCAGPEDLPDRCRVFVREEYSRKHCPRAELAPDLALAYSFDWQPPEAVHYRGVWLRQDSESLGYDLGSLGDPINGLNDPRDYINLAAEYENIVTDRLHFAIAGLIAGRRVTLLPNSYHKNRGVFKAWLKKLGCHWMNIGKSVRPDSVVVQKVKQESLDSNVSERYNRKLWIVG